MWYATAACACCMLLWPFSAAAGPSGNAQRSDFSIHELAAQSAGFATPNSQNRHSTPAAAATHSLCSCASSAAHSFAAALLAVLLCIAASVCWIRLGCSRSSVPAPMRGANAASAANLAFRSSPVGHLEKMLAHSDTVLQISSALRTWELNCKVTNAEGKCDKRAGKRLIGGAASNRDKFM